jgi:hypothetical protein
LGAISTRGDFFTAAQSLSNSNTVATAAIAKISRWVVDPAKFS